jgi:uncharacterized membrane protein
MGGFFVMSVDRALTLGVKINEKSIATLVFSMLLPNLRGTLHLSTPWGFKINLSQYAIFLAAFTFGPVGGLFSGFAGFLHAAYVMTNPYILVGGALLGLSTGFFSSEAIVISARPSWVSVSRSPGLWSRTTS